jgi:hypothetical protein
VGAQSIDHLSDDFAAVAEGPLLAEVYAEANRCLEVEGESF